jgi:RecB family endonuclease NucS
MASAALVPVPSITFSIEQVLGRADLQRLLRARIDMIVEGVLVVSEEFGAFTDARRRIDLLGVDRDGRLVVFELKRTADGGHLELQALRYAAMVSAGFDREITTTVLWLTDVTAWTSGVSG